jgi:UDPglucose 6-dehydrogenase
LATRISMMNEVAKLCDSIGADVMDVRKGIGSDKRIGMNFLYSGIGYGGSCFPKDVKALSQVARENNCSNWIFEAVEQVNKNQKQYLTHRILNYFNNSVKGKKFALWGLSFKPDTDDIRESPALQILKRLTELGASIVAYDPISMDNVKSSYPANEKVSFADNMYDALENADALILATEWRQFRKPDFDKMKALMNNNVIFDGRNQYDPKDLKKLDFTYFGIGRGY